MLRRPQFRAALNAVLAERGNPLGKPRNLARSRILVDDATSNAARQFRLRTGQRRLGIVGIAALDRALDLLEEGADPADARAVDGGVRRRPSA